MEASDPLKIWLLLAKRGQVAYAHLCYHTRNLRRLFNVIPDLALYLLLGYGTISLNVFLQPCFVSRELPVGFARAIVISLRCGNQNGILELSYLMSKCFATWLLPL